ncbi:MBL fold hydrolase [Clostridia bacterium]|nr:MBL fold hydrolase [Clostridia bacterium]
MKRRYSKTLRGEVRAELRKLTHGIIMWLIVCAVFGGFYIADGYFGWNLLPHRAVADTASARVVDTEGAVVAVHFLDVGQGDSELIVTPDKTMLIDSGEEQYADEVTAFLKAQSIHKLDYIIATHPHSDHMGGMSRIIADFPPAVMILPKVQDSVVPTTSVYERMLTAVAASGCEVVAAVPGYTVDMGHGASVKLLAPVRDYDDLNSYSVVAKLTFGSDSFLFTGDIEQEAEHDIVKATPSSDLRTDVLKIAHHGSKTSSTQEFLTAVAPRYAVIEVGAGNSYGHPAPDTLTLLKTINAAILRTDELGNITFLCDGNGGYKIRHSRAAA